MSFKCQRLLTRLWKTKVRCYSSGTDGPSRFDLRDPVTGETHRQWTVPLGKREGEWKSSLKIFETDTNYRLMRWIQTPVDLRWKSIKRWLLRRSYLGTLEDQAYKKERHRMLGPNLATAHFVYYRNGSLRFRGGPWLKHEEKGGEDDAPFPNIHDRNYLLEALDLTDSNLLYEGYTNLRDLKHLRVLIVKNSGLLDDWCLDWLTGQVPNLEVLDLSGCMLITARGISTVHRLRNLKSMIVTDVPASLDPNFILTCAHLEEEIPGLVIEGVEYNLDLISSLEKVQKIPLERCSESLENAEEVSSDKTTARQSS